MNNENKRGPSTGPSSPLSATVNATVPTSLTSLCDSNSSCKMAIHLSLRCRNFCNIVISTGVLLLQFGPIAWAIPPEEICFFELGQADNPKTPMETGIAAVLIGDTLEFASKPTDTEPGVVLAPEIVEQLAHRYVEAQPTHIPVSAFTREFLSRVRSKAREEGFDPKPRDVLSVDLSGGLVQVRVLRGN